MTTKKHKDDGYDGLRAAINAYAAVAYVPRVPSTAVQAFQFEAIGFVNKRKDFKRLESVPSDDIAKKLFATIATKFAKHGFTGLEEAYLTEDDGQGKSDIKCFVCVRLVGISDLDENEEPSPKLAELMTSLSEAVCCASDGTWVLQPENWELASINEPEEAVN